VTVAIQRASGSQFEGCINAIDDFYRYKDRDMANSIAAYARAGQPDDGLLLAAQKIKNVDLLQIQNLCRY
jgi:hypothetical protein